MPRLTNDDRRRVAEASACLATMVDGGPPGVSAVLPDFRRLLGMPHALSFAVGDRGEGPAIDFLHGYGVPTHQVSAALGEMARHFQGRFGGFDALRPERAQRNVPMTMRDVVAAAARPMPVVGELFPRFGIAGYDQLRVLVCDGESLLAWVGGFREAPFTGRDKQVLGALVPALRRRLAVERQLGEAPLAIAALAAALEAVGTAAFVIRGSGAVVHANSAGRALLDQDRRMVTALLHDQVRGVAAAAFDLVHLQGGVPDHWLALLRGGARPDPTPRAAAAVRRWGLTPREREVLGRLALGEANKTIADALGCSPNTVEVHVSGLLEKSGCESRAQLVARFWTRL
ncbi:MAG TPA: LuxR family transcriptional regulator [Anaeromyxobacteraceae bacterium]